MTEHFTYTLRGKDKRTLIVGKDTTTILSLTKDEMIIEHIELDEYDHPQEPDIINGNEDPNHYTPRLLSTDSIESDIIHYVFKRESTYDENSPGGEQEDNGGTNDPNGEEPNHEDNNLLKLLLGTWNGVAIHEYINDEHYQTTELGENTYYTSCIFEADGTYYETTTYPNEDGRIEEQHGTYDAWIDEDGNPGYVLRIDGMDYPYLILTIKEHDMNVRSNLVYMDENGEAHTFYYDYTR